MAAVSNQTSKLRTLESRGMSDFKPCGNVQVAQTSASLEKCRLENVDLFGNSRNEDFLQDRTPDVDKVFPGGTRPNILLPSQVFNAEIYVLYPVKLK